MRGGGFACGSNGWSIGEGGRAGVHARHRGASARRALAAWPDAGDRWTIRRVDGMYSADPPTNRDEGSMPDVTFSVLGSVEANVGDRAAALGGGGRQRALLAVLLLSAAVSCPWTGSWTSCGGSARRPRPVPRCTRWCTGSGGRSVRRRSCWRRVRPDICCAPGRRRWTSPCSPNSSTGPGRTPGRAARRRRPMPSGRRSASGGDPLWTGRTGRSSSRGRAARRDAPRGGGAVPRRRAGPRTAWRDRGGAGLARRRAPSPRGVAGRADVGPLPLRQAFGSAPGLPRRPDAADRGDGPGTGRTAPRST